MKFGKFLKDALKERNMTGKKLSELTGISPSMISQYKNGVEPPDESRLKIFEALGMEDPALEQTVRAEKYSVTEAARLLDMSPGSVKIALQRNMFSPQIGLAIPHPGGTYTYEIFKERLDSYKAATDFKR